MDEKSKRVTQQDRVLRILEVGGWWTGLDFVQLKRPILSYTKIISELRRQGYPIERERRGGVWKYRLVS